MASKNWPALILGCVVAYYWFRVMIMVRQTKKRTGHGANLVPPERLGRILRLIWGPVTLLWVFLPLLAFIVSKAKRYPPELQKLLTVHTPPIAVGAGAAIVGVACMGATMVCWRRMGTSWRMGIDPNDKTQLVCNGPFAYVRHPIYGLSSLLMIATMVAVPSMLMLAAGIIHVSLLQWEARREEKYLIELHGEEYRQYMRRTGRFFPVSFRAYCPAGNAALAGT